MNLRSCIPALAGTLLTFGLFGQSLKELDFAERYASLGLEAIEVHQLRNATPQGGDTCMYKRLQLDPQGRVEQCTNYFACGREFSKEFFFYADADARVPDSIHFASFHSGWSRRAYRLEYNEQGRVASRTLTSDSGEFLEREVFGYGPEGFLVKYTQERWKDGTWMLTHHEDFRDRRAEIERRSENDLTHIYDLNGLPLVIQQFAQDGSLRHALLYTYRHRDGAEASAR